MMKESILKNKSYLFAIRIVKLSQYIQKNTKDISIGSLQELEDSEFGKVTWLIAEVIYERFTP